ncbi:MAG: rod shape-determining protein MreD [Clostridia bacterium]|nr:rod shape-determining protein MreD [Clostridia bacterium]
MAKTLRISLTVLYVFLILVLQTTVIGYARIFGIIPNLLLISSVCYLLVTSDFRGLVFSVVCGILLDITGGRIIGVNTLLCTYIAFSCLWICDKLYNNNEIIAAFFTFIITFAYGLLIYIINFLLWGELNVFYALLRIALPEALYNALLALFIYPLIKLIVNGPKKKREKVKYL